MKLSSFIAKLAFAFYFSLLAFHFSIAQDTSICYLRDANGRIREHNVDFTKMKLDVKFDTKQGKVLGKVNYEFKPIQFVLDTLFLNAEDMEIKSVGLDGQATPYTTDSTGVTIRFLQAMDWNKTYKLEINYEATPRKGLYFIGWNVDLPAAQAGGKNTDSLPSGQAGDRYFTRHQIWTQGQGIDNRHWIPCYDDVTDKMLTETTITFDSSYTVISNGVLKEKKKNTDGTATWHYAMNKPMVSYLIMLAIDKYAYKDYKSKNGMVSRQYYYADQPQTADPTYQYSAEMMDWLPKQTGVAYPWQCYSNVPVQDFMFGAMENTTATIYGDFLMNDARAAMDRPYYGTNAHELTHQWFGDYVTEYSGQHHWLHESFATYYSKQFLHSVFGEDYYQWSKRQEAYQAINADKQNRYPVAHSLGGSARHYPKGSHVIDMLRYVVGDSVYQRCVSNYLKKHAYSNVSNHDFQFAFLETAGVNLDWFFDEWVYRAGIPDYEVKYERTKDNLVFYVNQVQKTDELTGYFKMPLVFEVYYKDGSSSSKKVWLSRASDTIYISASGGEGSLPAGRQVDYTLFDPASNVLKSVEFKKTYEELSAQALKAKNMIDRYDALIALRDFDTEKKRDLLVKVFDKETFHQTKEEVVGQLAKDTNAVSLAFLKRALHDKDFQVRKSVADNVVDVHASILPDFEKLLSDSSYYTIETVLRKLCKQYPDKVKQYLNETKNTMGISNNVRIAWLEMSCKEQPTGADITAHQNKLVDYTSNRYEFRTRTRAMESLERLSYCNEDLIKNLFNACVNPNGRLANPASKVLKALLKKDKNLEMAKGLYGLMVWKDWERKIIEAQLK